MTMGETVNFWGSLVALVGCVVFIGVYSVMPFLTGRSRWWHSLIGRMLVAKAAASKLACSSGLLFIRVRWGSLARSRLAIVAPIKMALLSCSQMAIPMASNRAALFPRISITLSSPRMAVRGVSGGEDRGQMAKASRHHK